ncbi:threonine/serine exporter ThrE family protein [Alienimonas sp. DA493]|uniref:threonine/serine ThrE exporter family protein n=1 Tax=Alienimonas sp. DA493 TaxID=3373605 RepID=UPI0037549A0B
MTTEPEPPDTAELIIELASALHRYGVPAHELEELMVETGAALGVAAQYFAAPTAVQIAFGESREHRTTMIRVLPGEVNLAKLRDLYELQAAVAAGTTDAAAGRAGVRAIEDRPPRFGPAWTAPATGLVGATAAPFFGGGWVEAALAGTLALLVGLLAWLSASRPRLQSLLLPGSSVLVSAAAIGTGALWPDLAAAVVTVSALILFIPGLTLTIAMNELAAQNLVSGSARFAGAVAQLMMIGFGVELGRSLVALAADLPPPGPEKGLGDAVVAGSLVVASLAFTVLFQALARDFVWICVAAFVAFFGARLGVALLGPLAGPSVAAFGVGAFSNAIGRWRQQPALVTLLPGLLLLVPGSVGFRSITQLLDHDELRSFQSVFNTLLIAAAIVTGLLFANLAVARRPGTGERLS